ncbi:MAG TPA: hypothetical protein VGO71_05770 [Baekduia sp.]|nr:hypothetical protein [Baekduia sp.]
MRQGRTDAWVAHQLEVTVQQIEAFKKENELLPDGESAETPGGDFDDEIDLRAEDDALIAAELEAEAARKAEAGEDEEPADEDDDAPKRRRGRRGGRGRARRKDPTSYEGTFDHGEEGYGLWLDPAVADDGTYAEHWAGHRPVEVTIEADQIIIRRAGDAAADDADADPED